MSQRSARMRGALLAGASVALTACSLLVDTSGLTSAQASDAALAADAADAEEPPAPPLDGAPADAPTGDADAGAICPPGFTGPECATPCPAGMAGRACDYRRVLALDIPVTGVWKVAADVPYRQNDAASVAAFSRVAYRVVLDASEVWVEMDAFTTQATRLGVPVDWLFQQVVENVVVLSFAPTVREQLVPAKGRIEMYSNCYGEGDDGTFDDDDIVSASEPDCYGSMQVHVDGKTVFALNRWSEGSGALDLGIGERPINGPDWTFAQSAGAYTKRLLEVYVR